MMGWGDTYEIKPGHGPEHWRGIGLRLTTERLFTPVRPRRNGKNLELRGELSTEWPRRGVYK